MTEEYCWRPLHRSDCLPGGSNASRPCPYVGCKYHLCVEVRGRNVVERRPVEDGAPTCALDVAEQRDGITFDEIGQYFGGITRESVRRIHDDAIQKVAKNPRRWKALATFAGDGTGAPCPQSERAHL